MLKKSVTPNKKKAVSKNTIDSNKIDIRNVKTKSATSKKIVNKKVILKNKINPVKKVKLKELSEEKDEFEFYNQENTTVSEILEPKKEVDYNEATFQVKDAELSFLKQSDESFLIKLITGVNIKRRDELNFEFRGFQADGTDFGTIFTCIDSNEAIQFMSELINCTNEGKIVIIGHEGTQSETTTQDSNIQVEDIQNPTQVNQIDYSGVPIKTEDMTTIINALKTSELKNNPNSGFHNQMVANPIPPNTASPISFNPINNNMANAMTVQPPIVNQAPQLHQGIGAIVPSQNPQLTHDSNYHIHANSNPSINANGQFIENIPTVNTNEMIQDELRKYANSIEDTLNDTFQVRVQGGLSTHEFTKILTGCSQAYSYDVAFDGKGNYLIVAKGDFKMRVPEEPTEYLKVF